MGELEIPNLGALLAGVLAGLPESAQLGLVAGLERTAAERYREWAETSRELAPALLACAAREEEIAARVDRLAPVAPQDQPALRDALVRAREVYAGLFVGLPVRDRMVLQAHAERQGALAWRAFAARASDAATRDALNALAELEIASADAVDGLLGLRSTGRG